jgi:hypothetical protein
MRDLRAAKILSHERIFSAIVGCLQQNSQSLSGNICTNGLQRSGLS